MSNRVMQLAQDAQLMNLSRAQMQICLALDYLSPDRICRLTAVTPPRLSQRDVLLDACQERPQLRHLVSPAGVC